MKRVLNVTEPGPNGSTTTTTLSGPTFGWFTWVLLAGLLYVLAHDSLKSWHIPAIIAFWPLSALGWYFGKFLGTRR